MWGNERLPWVGVTTPSFSCTPLSAIEHRGAQPVGISTLRIVMSLRPQIDNLLTVLLIEVTYNFRYHNNNKTSSYNCIINLNYYYQFVKTYVY
jgi:hypothetical protein